MLDSLFKQKAGEREQKVLPLQTHGRKAAGSCSAQKQHLQLGCSWEVLAAGSLLWG